VTLLDRFAERVEWVDVEELADVGAKGMFLPLQDPFSALMDSVKLKKLMQAMGSGGKDTSLGIGPTRTKAGDWKIAHIRGGYTGADAGLKIGDRILAIDGQDVKAIPPTQVPEKLKADEGESVRLTVQREGWPGPRTVTLVQGSTKRVNVSHEMLPGKIGYVRALIFNLSLARDVEKALKALEKEGMRGLVLDLRGNPGGALPACVAVADKFLSGGKVIATMETHHPFMQRKQTFRTKDKGTHPDFPMVVLIDKASASASEMLSGSLKYNKRALVIGETSYGKGVGQSIMPVGAKLSHHKTPQFFYITLMEYYLPEGVVVQHKGVVPDIEEKPFEPLGDTLEKVWKLRDKGMLARWAEGAAKEDGERLRRALGFNSVGAARLPGVVALAQTLDSGLDRETLAFELCRASRRALEKAEGKILLVRPQEDRVLCRGLFELATKLGMTPGSAPEYGAVFRMFRKSGTTR
jgi:carboxyl-terminal processing protease